MNVNKGDNSFQGNGWNDIIDGAKGVDTAVYRGPAADYKINILENRIEVVDNNPDRDGKDILINMEKKSEPLKMTFMRALESYKKQDYKNAETFCYKICTYMLSVKYESSNELVK